MDPLSLTLSITTLITLTRTVVLYIKEAKDASDERKGLVRELNILRGMLTSLVEFINDCDLGDPWIKAIKELVKQDGPLDHFTLTLRLLAHKLSPDSSLRKLGQALFWKHVKDDIASSLSQIERLKSLIGVAFQMDHMSLSHAIQADVEDVQLGIADLKVGNAKIQSDTTMLQDEVSANQKSELLNMICSADYFPRHRDNVVTRAPGTGRKFLDDDNLRNWKESTNGTMLCSGVPGAGKTVVAGSIIEDLLRTIQAEDSPITFIYFNYKRESEQTIAHVISSILRQIVEALPGVPKDVKAFYDAHRDKHTTPLPEDVKLLLRSTVAALAGLWIVTDALDECSDNVRLQTISVVEEMRSTTKIRYLATSRPFPGIVADPVFTLHLEIKATFHDLKSYIGQRFDSFKVKPTLHLQKEIVEAVIAAAGGIFLLARLLVNSFEDKIKVKTIKDQLSRLPGGSNAYDVAYDDAMERIFKQSGELKECARRVLSFVLYAKRPLDQFEVEEALMIDHGDRKLDEDNRIGIEVIVSSCAGLVVHDRRSDTVGFVHFTTQEYLQRTQSRWLPEAAFEVARTCLSYLMLDPFTGTDGRYDFSRNSSSKRHPYALADYATKFSLIHLDLVYQVGYTSQTRDMASLVMALLQSSERPWVVRGVIWKNTRRQSSTEEIKLQRLFVGNPLAFVAWSGLTGLLKVCIDQGLDADLKDEHSMTALHHVAERGVIAAARLLLQPGVANPSLREEGGQTPLSIAAKNGNSLIVKMLLETGDADVDSPDDLGRTPLSYAATHGNLDTLTLLLETSMVDLLSSDKHGRTPLFYAAREAQTKPKAWKAMQVLVEAYISKHQGSDPEALNSIRQLAETSKPVSQRPAPRVWAGAAAVEGTAELLRVLKVMAPRKSARTRYWRLKMGYGRYS